MRSHIDESTLPLSAAQTQVWTAASLYPDDATLNLGNYLDITGPLDIPAITSAVRRAVTEAEALRTTIVEEAAAARQVITPIGDWSLPVADLRAAAHPDRAAQEWMREDLRRPFDLRDFPLFRFALLRLADDRHFLYECVHHIAWDGHSWAVYYPRLAELYAAAISGRRVGGDGFPPFRKLLDDELAWSRSDDAARQERHWKRRFSTAAEPVSLSDRPLVPAGGRIRRRDRVPPRVAERIRAVAWEARVTWSTAVVAAAAAFTGRMTGRRDVLLTLPVTGRVGAVAHGIPGLRAKHLPLPLSVRPETSRAELLRQTGAELRRALGAQLVPAARLRRILGIPSDDLRPYGPSINVLPSLGRLTFGPCDGTLHILSNGVVQDLQINVYDDGSAGFDVYVDANPNLYDAEDLTTLGQRFAGYLESFAEADTPPGRADLLTPVERRGLVEWNDTEDPRVLDDVMERIREIAAARPHLVAVADDSGEVRYPELTREADATADRIRAAGAAPDEVVAILAEPGSRFVAAMLGVLAAGCACLPLDPGWPLPHAAALLSASGARRLLADPGRRDHADRIARSGGAQVDVLSLSGAGAGGPAPGAPHGPPAVTGDNLAYLMFTSGSAGRPKAVMVTRRGMGNHLLAKIEELGLSESDTVLQNAPLTFDVSVWQILAPLVVGGRVRVVDRRAAGDPAALFELAAAERVTVLQLVPSLLRATLDAWDELGSEPPPGALRWLVTVGEELPADLCARWRRRFPDVPILNSYGPTECSDGVAHAVLRAAEQIHHGRVPIGGPTRNTRLHVLDDELRPVPVGVPGELHVAGAGVARGYLSDPGRTACSFVPDPHSTLPGGRMYRTGDRVRRRADGWLEYLGRADNQVKIRGQRVELDEVAALLRALPGVRDAAAAAYVDHAGRTQLVGYLVGAADIATARADAAAALPGHLLPSAYVPLDELPRTGRGKLDRAALPPPEQPGATGGRAPRTARERLLAELCAAVLGVDRVGVEDNFFALGGDSISAIALSARCRSAGLDIAPHEIFQRRTVEALAAAAPAASASPTRPAPPRPSLMAAEAQRLRADYPDLCDVLPLSPLQEGFLYHALLQDSRADVYRMQVTADISGPLDPAALRKAVRALLARHPNLRAGFVPHGLRQPVQVVPATAEPAWRDLQLSQLTEADRAERLRRLARAEFRREFDLARPPLLRCALARIDPQRHRLILTGHHILFDGWSIPVLAQELLALCGQVDLKPPATSYGDYLGWLAGQDREAALAAWRSALDGLEHPTRLTRATAPPGAVFPETHTVELPERLTERLAALARAHGLTLNTVLQCCWAVLLGSLTGRDDVVFGATVAVRPTEIPGVDTLVGMCVNTVPVRVRLDPAESWLGLLARAQAEQAALTPCQFLDLAAIQQLAPADGELFDSLVVLENIPLPDQAPQTPSGLRIEAVQVDSATHYPLCLSVFPGERLRLRLDYRPDAFSRDEAATVAERLSRLLRSLVAAPRQRIDQVTVLSPAERRRLLLERNDTAVEAPELTASRLFERQAAATPGAAAVVSRDRTLTYRQLNARANRLARLLAERGAGPEQVVAVALPRSAETVVALLAVLKAGAAHLGLDLTAPIARNRAILDDARPALVVTDSTVTDRFAVPSVVLDQPDVAATLERCPEGDLSSAELIAPVRGDNPGYVVYTSGSTGGPKGVVMPVRGLVNLLCWHTSSFPGGVGTRTAQFLSIGFDFAIEEILQALLAGKTLVTAPERTHRDFAELVDWIDRARINELFAPTPVLDALLATAADRGSDLDSLTDLVQGGEQFRVSAELRAFCRARPRRRAHNLYGPSETHVVSMATLPEEVDRWPEAAPIGLPVWNTTMYVVDSMLRPVPPGVAGELYVGGAQLARGYLNAPARTAERFVPDPFGPAGARLYRTGDLVRWNSDCELEFLGRVDDQVKVRGHRVEPGEVAGVLAQQPGVASAVVVPRANPAGGVDLVAYVAPAGGAPVEPQELRRRLRQLLPDYLTPAAIVPLDELPLTPNGKVDRRALPRPADAARPRGRQPANRREAILRRLYAEVLGVEAGVDDNFFDLGGNSLSATRLIGRARAALGLDLAIRTLMESPTPAELARRLGAAGDDFAPLLPLKPSGAGAPLFCVHPAAGLSWGYTALAGHMAAEHPLYGLQAPALHRRRRLCSSMAEAAEDYATRIRRVQPVGPYRLLGWSFGGVLAHEIAVRLQAAGQRVCSLMVLDSPWRLPPGELPDDQQVFARLLLTAGYLREELPSGPLSAADAAAMLRDRDRPFTERRLLRIAEVYRNHVRLAQEFTPGTYHGRMVYFLAARGRTDPGRQAADWSRFATGDIDYHEVDCEHQQMMSPGPITRIGPIVASELRRSGLDPEWEER